MTLTLPVPSSKTSTIDISSNMWHTKTLKAKTYTNATSVNYEAAAYLTHMTAQQIVRDIFDQKKSKTHVTISATV